MSPGHAYKNAHLADEEPGWAAELRRNDFASEVSEEKVIKFKTTHCVSWLIRAAFVLWISQRPWFSRLTRPLYLCCFILLVFFFFLTLTYWLRILLYRKHYLYISSSLVLCTAPGLSSTHSPRYACSIRGSKLL